MLKFAPQIFNDITTGSQTWIILMLIALWVIPWKAVALWKSARNNQKGWFVVLMLLNTIAIVDAIYIFIFSDKKGKDKCGCAPAVAQLPIVKKTVKKIVKKNKEAVAKKNSKLKMTANPMIAKTKKVKKKIVKKK
ncbi:MAG: DUF5652 family protein [bacterium]